MLYRHQTAYAREAIWRLVQIIICIWGQQLERLKWFLDIALQENIITEDYNHRHLLDVYYYNLFCRNLQLCN